MRTLIKAKTVFVLLEIKTGKQCHLSKNEANESIRVGYTRQKRNYFEHVKLE